MFTIQVSKLQSGVYKFLKLPLGQLSCLTSLSTVNHTILFLILINSLDPRQSSMYVNFPTYIHAILKKKLNFNMIYQLIECAIRMYLATLQNLFTKLQNRFRILFSKYTLIYVSFLFCFSRGDSFILKFKNTLELRIQQKVCYSRQ